MTNTPPEVRLARAALALRWEDASAEARKQIKDLFLDWMASALAGSRSKQAATLDQVSRVYGGATGVPGRTDAEAGHAWGPDGVGTVLTDFRRAPVLAVALVNAAASHVVEMDDLHNGSIYHPATCVFPAALALAEALDSTEEALLTACLAGYEVSLRIGEALGPEHYVYFHTTGTAGAFGAAVAAGVLLGLDEEALLWAMGNAGSQAAGLWQFLEEGTMTKQLHTAKAAQNGLLAALLASQGFTGPTEVLLGDKSLIPATTLAGAYRDRGRRLEPADWDRLERRWREKLLEGLKGDGAEVDGAGLGGGEVGGEAGFTRFKTPEVSFKYHASCRHTHPAVDALLKVMREHRLSAEDLEAVHAFLYTGGYERLKDVRPTSPWAAKFNLPFCLAQAALRGRLDLGAFTEDSLKDPQVLALAERMDLSADPALDELYPRQWGSRVEVRTVDGRRLEGRIDFPKGDPENPLSDEELRDKFTVLAQTRLPEAEAAVLLERLWPMPVSGRKVRALLADVGFPSSVSPANPDSAGDAAPGGAGAAKARA